MEVGRRGGKKGGRNNGKSSKKEDWGSESEGEESEGEEAEAEARTGGLSSWFGVEKKEENAGGIVEVIPKDECLSCGWKGEVDWECRFCPRCEWELKGWSERRGKERPRGSGLKFKQILDSCGVEDCWFC